MVQFYGDEATKTNTSPYGALARLPSRNKLFRLNLDLILHRRYLYYFGVRSSVCRRVSDAQYRACSIEHRLFRLSQFIDRELDAVNALSTSVNGLLLSTVCYCQRFVIVYHLLLSTISPITPTQPLNSPQLTPNSPQLNP